VTQKAGSRTLTSSKQRPQRLLNARSEARLLRSTRSEKGSALVELAVCLPLLALILVGTADFARVFYTTIQLTNAARAGAQFGAAGVTQSGDVAGMQTTAMTAINFTSPGITATASRSCGCATDPGVFSGPVSCTAPISVACSAGQHRVMTVTVTTSKAFSTISGLAGIPVFTQPLERSATMRVSE